MLHSKKNTKTSAEVQVLSEHYAFLKQTFTTSIVLFCQAEFRALEFEDCISFGSVSDFPHPSLWHLRGCGPSQKVLSQRQKSILFVWNRFPWDKSGTAALEFYPRHWARSRVHRATGFFTKFIGCEASCQAGLGEESYIAFQFITKALGGKCSGLCQQISQAWKSR